MEELTTIISLWEKAPYIVAIGIIIIYWKKISVWVISFLRSLQKMAVFFDWYEKHAGETKEQSALDMKDIKDAMKAYGDKFETFANEEAKKSETFIQQLMELKIDHERTKKNTDQLTLRIDETEKSIVKIKEHIKFPETT